MTDEKTEEPTYHPGDVKWLSEEELAQVVQRGGAIGAPPSPFTAAPGKLDELDKRLADLEQRVQVLEAPRE